MNMNPLDRAGAFLALLCAVAACAPAAAHAQAALLGPGAAYLSGGVSRVATRSLDERLAARGYPQFGRTAVTVGVGGYRIVASRVLLGFEGQAFGVGQAEHNGGELALGGAHATLATGYAIALSPRLRAYPRIGVGAGGIALEFDTAEDSVAFDDVLTNPLRTSRLREPLLSRDGIVFDLGAGVEYVHRAQRGLLLGLRLGYLIAPWDSDWDSYERDAIGGPDASLSGFYLRLTAGGAWRR